MDLLQFLFFVPKNLYLYSTYRYRHMIHKNCHCFDWQLEYLLIADTVNMFLVFVY